MKKIICVLLISLTGVSIFSATIACRSSTTEREKKVDAGKKESQTEGKEDLAPITKAEVKTEQEKSGTEIVSRSNKTNHVSSPPETQTLERKETEDTGTLAGARGRWSRDIDRASWDFIARNPECLQAAQDFLMKTPEYRRAVDDYVKQHPEYLKMSPDALKKKPPEIPIDESLRRVFSDFLNQNPKCETALSGSYLGRLSHDAECFTDPSDLPIPAEALTASFKSMGFPILVHAGSVDSLRGATRIAVIATRGEHLLSGEQVVLRAAIKKLLPEVTLVEGEGVDDHRLVIWVLENEKENAASFFVTRKDFPGHVSLLFFCNSSKGDESPLLSLMAAFAGVYRKVNIGGALK